MKQTLLIRPDGTIDTIYSDHLAELDLGHQETLRASTVEFNAETQEWEARLTNPWLEGRPIGVLNELLAHGPNRRNVEEAERDVLMERLSLVVKRQSDRTIINRRPPRVERSRV